MDATLISKANDLWATATVTADYDPALCREQNAAATEVYWLACTRQGVDFDASGKRVFCDAHYLVRDTVRLSREPGDFLTIHTCAKCGAVMAIE